MPFSDYKTALVTGASSGIGAAIVERFRREGLEVHALARSTDALQELAGRTGCIAHAIDVRDLPAITQLTRDVQFDILVNCAGINFPGSIATATAEQVDAEIAVNLQSALHLVRLGARNVTQYQPSQGALFISQQDKRPGFAGRRGRRKRTQAGGELGVAQAVAPPLNVAFDALTWMGAKIFGG